MQKHPKLLNSTYLPTTIPVANDWRLQTVTSLEPYTADHSREDSCNSPLHRREPTKTKANSKQNKNKTETHSHSSTNPTHAYFAGLGSFWQFFFILYGRCFVLSCGGTAVFSWKSVFSVHFKVINQVLRKIHLTRDSSFLCYRFSSLCAFNRRREKGETLYPRGRFLQVRGGRRSNWKILKYILFWKKNWKENLLEKFQV